MSREEIVLNPQQLVESSGDLPLGIGVHTLHPQHALDHDVLDVSQQQAHMNILHPQFRSLLAVLEPRPTGVHDPHRIQIHPELALVAPILVGDQLHQVRLQEILPVRDLRMVEGEFLHVLGGDAVVPGLTGDEGFGGDVEGEEVGVDGVEDGGYEGRHEGCGGTDGGSIFGGEGEE